MSCFALTLNTEVTTDSESGQSIHVVSNMITTKINDDASTSVTVSSQPVKDNMFTIKFTVYVLCSCLC